MASLSYPETPSAAAPRIELWFRRAMTAFATVAAVLLMLNFALMIWAQNEFTGPESVVNAQADMLAHHGTLYYSLKTYPYTVCAYMPIVYNLQAALIRIGLRSALAGRLISFAALVMIFVLSWRLAMLYTSDRYAAATAVLCAASTSILVLWGTAGQVDMLAVCFSIAAFERYSCYAVLGERTLVWAGVFAGLAIFTKQTAIACPTAIFVLLWLERKKIALLFGSLFLSITGGAVLLVNHLLDGRFLQDTVRGNINPFAAAKLVAHLHYFLVAAGGLALIAALGFARVRGRKIAPFVYLAFALAVFLATASKVGSDFNYQIESNIVLILCAAIALDELDFFSLVFQGSKRWVTLLQIPLAVHLAVNLRIGANLAVSRYGNEQAFRTQIAALRPYLGDRGRLLSSDYNSMARLRGEIEVEPLIYSELVDAKVIDPEPVRRDLAARKFSTICLWTDVFSPAELNNPMGDEIANLPAAQLDEVRKRYKLVAHIPGPYLDGLYVYKPGDAR